MISEGVKLSDIIAAKKLLKENGYSVLKVTKEMIQDKNDCIRLQGNGLCSKCSCFRCVIR